jgi:hypothetical protein
MPVLETMRAIAEFSNGPVGCYKQLAGFFNALYIIEHNI